MNGARKYYYALQKAAAAQYAGFNHLRQAAYITNGPFLFDLNMHARGKTLKIYMFPQSLIGRTDLRRTSAVLEVYGITGGHDGWDETYGFLVDGPIKQHVQHLLDKAVEFEATMKSKQDEAERVRRDLETRRRDELQKTLEEELLASYPNGLPYSNT